MSKKFWSAALTVTAIACAQSDSPSLQTLLKDEVISNDVRAFQLREYLIQRIAPAPIVKDAVAWTAESVQLRKKLLEIIYHGWPPEWVNAPPRFEEVGVLPGNGYRIRKLRYEIVPGFFSPALNVTGRLIIVRPQPVTETKFGNRFFAVWVGQFYGSGPPIGGLTQQRLSSGYIRHLLKRLPKAALWRHLQPKTIHLSRQK